MPLAYNLPFLTIFLAMLGGILAPFVRREGRAFLLLQVVQGLCAIASAYLLWHLYVGDYSFTYQMGHFPAPWGNQLRAGPLEALMALVFSVVMLLSFSGGQEELRQDIPPSRRQGFYLLMHLQLASLLAMVYTDDLFTAYVFVEIAALCACLAVAAKDTGRAVVASIRYLVFSCLGSGLMLLGIAVLYAVTGHLLFTPLAFEISHLWTAGAYHLPLTAAALLLALGLAIKSAQVPFHAWLPDAHSSATSAASAILSGLVLKGYIILLLKLAVRVFGLELLRETHMADLFFLLGLLGMLWASLAALKQEDAKRMAAYSSSAQISYIYLAMGLGTQRALVAAACQILVHAATKSMIFVALGRLIRRGGGGYYWSDLRGSAHGAPLAGVAFTVGGLSLCGIPLMAGFSSKYAIAQAALDGGGRLLPTLMAIAASSVLNAMYYIPAILAIWGERSRAPAPEPCEEGNPWPFRVSVWLFLACNFLLGTAIGPLFQVLRKGMIHF